MKKYYLFTYNNKIKKVLDADNMKELKENITKKKAEPDNEYILLKLSKQKVYNSLVSTGPIKLTFKIYELINNNLKLKYEKIKNRKGELDQDKRNAQFLYYTEEYYKKYGIRSDDLKKVCTLAIQNKLEKRLLAPKLITQIL
jgi:hypothetical protein